MCCLFGLIDIKHQLSGVEKARVISILAEASEVRGIDATGYAFNSRGKLVIKKQPLPAHKVKFHVPNDAYVIMGHTRMTTQGLAQRNRNNHPFFGKVKGMPFALAHNGVLTNDAALRKNHGLPRSKIETDSYVAVQLIEKKNSLDLDTVRFMAEQVKGTFSFTVLDRLNRLYMVKGNNPLCLYYIDQLGIYLYASTRSILETALNEMGYDKMPHQEIIIHDGDILLIDEDGTFTWEYFTPPVNYSSYCHYDFLEPQNPEPNGYYKFLLDFASGFGVPKQELDWLQDMGYSSWDLEECVFSSSYRTMLLAESGYYDEEEEEYYGLNYDCLKSYAWT